jgi:mono/diheme cytochrome c family protein
MKNSSFGKLLPLVIGLVVVPLKVGPTSAETLLERGTYLMKSIAACGNCHTPKGPQGELPGM